MPLRDIALAALGDRADRWTIREDDVWCHLTPSGYPMRVQGWKLHVSATRLSAPLVLYEAARVLVAQECAFKFAATIAQVERLTRRDADRAQAGKFITAYPRDDDHLRELARLLDQATAGLPGPAILSDRPVRPGSLVHYRYGAFTGVPFMTNDASWEVRLEAPDGQLVEDRRVPWFAPPPWAGAPPFPGRPGRPATPPTDPKPVLLAGRFEVERAIRHTARGGVYRAVDRQTGRRVILKEARPHIGGFLLHGDAQDGLRHEAAMLTTLAGLTPELVLLFEHGPHLFLAVEEVEGTSPGAWAYDQAVDHRVTGAGASDRDGEIEGPPVAAVTALAGRLADLLDEVHARGLVFRDLSPGNVMVRPDGSVVLVDTELVTRQGDWVGHAHTPGFVAPEIIAGPPVGPAPGPGTDHYSLGALLCHVATGANVAFPPDRPVGVRRAADRIALLLRYATARNPAALRLAPAILGLTAEDPAERWDTARLRDFLASPAPASVDLPAGGPVAALEPDRCQALLADCLAYLTDQVLTTPPEQLPLGNGDLAYRSDVGNMHHGVAGILAVLVRAAELADAGAELPADRLREAVVRLTRWLDRRRTSVSPLLPGLHFGRAGTAWALYTAGCYLDDPGVIERALELACALPLRWPNPDITHGGSGVGMAHLYLWSQTKEPVLRERLLTAADDVAARAVTDDDGRVHWPVPEDFDSKLAGARHYGYAHGVAGVGAFLLAAARATGRDDYRDLAYRAGETLAAATARDAGGTYWPNDISGPSGSDLRFHWCSGASGVGTFLLRLWRAGAGEEYRRLAEEAAVTVRRGRWHYGVSICHGLAGNAEFLVDLAEAGAGDHYREWAAELAACLYARHTLRDGLMVVTDDRTGRVSLDFGVGLAGVAAFLLRLCHGGPRWWMVDDPRPTD